ncbi:MAG: bifunctional (p)ppGpp synthetase/guanosine-3',5'-bis(diphosphate) 3'-pyrophosphohydrolase, partial [Bacteroidota bacterium]
NASEKEAGIVKLADRITNLQGPPYHWSKEKAASYREEAKLILDSLKGKNAYLESRLAAFSLDQW